VTRPGAVGMRPEAMAGLRPSARPHAGCRAGWQTATVTEVRQETPAARTLVLEAPGWAGHDAGQHVEPRLRLPDRSPAVRSYSIASAPRPRGRAAWT
jgi:ferredoxin-NADP reductase